MLLPELNTPVGFAGKDGFYWWLGQVETDRDKKNSNRYKVRIVGQHLKSCEAVPYDDLPWATVMLPVTAPSSLGNSNYTPSRLSKGDWVVGFFMDGAAGQHPIIMGQFARVFNSTSNDQLEATKPSTACLGFDNGYVPPTNPAMAQPAGANQMKASARQSGKGDEPASAAIQASAGANTPGNPMGRYACHQIADAGCNQTGPTEKKLESALTEIFGAISQNGGTIGTKMLSEASGQLFDYAQAGRGYVTRIAGIANVYLRNAKFRMISLLKQGVQSVIRYLMGVPTPPIGDNPKSGPVTKKKSVGFLGKLVKQMNDSLSKINCQFADFEQKLIDFLTDLITNLLMDIVNAATCVIESIVNQVLSQIESFLTGIIDAVLGPLQAILGIIASPLNILGAALQYIFQLIGLSCTGPGNKCSSKTEHCTGGANKKKPGEDDFAALDSLIANIESQGQVPLQTTCEEAYNLPCPTLTTAGVNGGTPGPGSRPAATPPISPVDPYETIITPLPDSPPIAGNNTAPTSLFPPVNATIISQYEFAFTGTESVAAIGVPDSYYSITSSGEMRFVEPVTYSQFIPNPLVVTQSLDFSLSSDKTRVTAKDNISFTLSVTSGSVPDGTTYNYLIFGSIENRDFINNTTIGTIRMSGGIGVVTITLSDTLSITSDTTVTFSVLGVGATADFTMYTNVAAPTTTLPNQFVPPVLGNPVVDNNGRILDIPIVNPGDPYLSPPFIAIYGEGIGGYASPQLDNSGKLTKVIIDRPGVGYTPTITTDDNCYISGFIIIRPGYAYSSAPTIYIDGDPNIVRAVVNERGNLVSINIINKVKTFNEFPTIEIIGGGGMGAKAIPSFSCVDPEIYEKYANSVAPSGVAEVVDCPNGDCDDCSI